MKKELRKEIKIAIWGAIAGAVATSLIDVIKSKPFYSSIWFGLKWVWVNLLSFPVPVWAVLIILILSRIKFSKEKAGDPQFTTYKVDKFDNVKWRWNWHFIYGHGWDVTNLRPLCVKCDTSCELAYSYGSDYMRCPRCDWRQNLIKSTDDIKRIIHDNIDKEDYPKN